MNALAERFGIPLVLKGTPYGRRVPVGEEAVSQAALEAAFDGLAGGAGAAATSAGDAIARLDLEAPVSALIRTRVAISNGHPADDLAVSVLDEGASTFGDFDNHTLAGGNMRLAEALAAELGAAVHLSSPLRSVRWSQGTASLATDGAEIEVDAVVVAIPTAPLAEIEFDPPLEGATAEALRAVTYGQNSKLFLRLRSPAPPSAIMSVAGALLDLYAAGCGWSGPLPSWSATPERCPRSMPWVARTESSAGSLLSSRFAGTSIWNQRAQCSRAGTTTPGCGAPTRLALSHHRFATTTWRSRSAPCSLPESTRPASGTG